MEGKKARISIMIDLILKSLRPKRPSSFVGLLGLVMSLGLKHWDARMAGSVT